MSREPSVLPGLRVIGVVRSRRAARADTPVQSSLNRDELATVEIDPRFRAGLEGLSGFDYVWLVSWLDADDPGEDPPLRQVPFLLQASPREMGVFATRGPRRVKPLGLSLVRVVEIGPEQIRFAGVDLVDGTPVVDIKPYVARFDRPPGQVRCGWFDEVEVLEGSTPASLANGSRPSDRIERGEAHPGQVG